MSASAWLMLIFASLILYGGVAVCVVIAIQNAKRLESDDDFEDTGNDVVSSD